MKTTTQHTPFDHTPAPWGHSALPALSEDWYSITDANGIEVARVPRVAGEKPTETNGRARLLAAAPELLEALKQIADQLEQWNLLSPWAKDDQSALDRARAAIAKAEGRA